VALGIVTDNQDPEDQAGQVKFPTISDVDSSWWARVAVPGGGPEGHAVHSGVNDEVLVGFPFGEPLQPSSAVRSRSASSNRTGHTVTLDDAQSGGGITIEDPKGNKIFLDTQKNSLLIAVQKDIEIKAQGNIKIAAQGQLEITAAAGAKVESSATLDLKGAIVNLN
jgi:uncharacterized protein involved in type VI secretion and phage assembly